jgi:hypothetical protein
MSEQRAKTIRLAGQAVSDLNIFYGVVALLEGGTIHAPSHKAANRIIKICKAESAKRLAEYDRLVAKASKP